ncbi:Fumarylacetoacetase [Manis javanica]|nr:Fumarylacetoacetase [Manis javanica]
MPTLRWACNTDELLIYWARIRYSSDQQGAAIALHGQAAASAETDALVREIAQTHGVPVRHYRLDLRDGCAIAPLAQRIAAEMGAIDILVNNAGMQHEPAARIPGRQVGRAAGRQPVGALPAIQACTQCWSAAGGRIINIASVSGLVGVARRPAYVASKHGLIGLTKSVALEFATTPVTCAICPGWAARRPGAAALAIGDQVLDLARLRAIKALGDAVQPQLEAASQQHLNGFMAMGPTAWSALRLALSRALREGAAAGGPAGLPGGQSDVEYTVPAQVGDYTDFYASVHHATNVGQLFRRTTR